MLAIRQFIDSVTIFRPLSNIHVSFRRERKHFLAVKPSCQVRLWSRHGMSEERAEERRGAMIVIVKTNKVVVETEPQFSPVVTWVHLIWLHTEECWHGCCCDGCDAYQVLMSEIREAALPLYNRILRSKHCTSVVLGWDPGYN